MVKKKVENCGWCDQRLPGRQKQYCGKSCRMKFLKDIESRGISQRRRDEKKESVFKVLDLVADLEASEYDDVNLLDAAILPRWKVLKSEDADGIYLVRTPSDMNKEPKPPYRSGDRAWLVEFLLEHWVPKARVFLDKYEWMLTP